MRRATMAGALTAMMSTGAVADEWTKAVRKYLDAGVRPTRACSQHTGTCTNAIRDGDHMMLRYFDKHGIEPASDDGEGYSAHQMMDALHEHESEVDAAHQAEIARLRHALAEIARQKLIDEMDDPTVGDFEEGYEACVSRARAALGRNAT
jgi:hypothetical protein